MTMYNRRLRLLFLETVDPALQKYDVVSKDVMLESYKIWLIQKATNEDKKLQNIWNLIKTII